MAKKWGGREAMQLRMMWKQRILAGNVLCCRCGKPITHNPAIVGGGWDVDHYPIPREFGGKATHPAHARGCNRSAGGKRGAAITNARKAVNNARMTPERDRGIRGI